MHSSVDAGRENTLTDIGGATVFVRASIQSSIEKLLSGTDYNFSQQTTFEYTVRLILDGAAHLTLRQQGTGDLPSASLGFWLDGPISIQNQFTRISSGSIEQQAEVPAGEYNVRFTFGSDNQLASFNPSNSSSGGGTITFELSVEPLSAAADRRENITETSTSDGTVKMSFSNLKTGVVYLVQRSATLSEPIWATVAELEADQSSSRWEEAIQDGASSAFFRLVRK